MNDPLDGTIMIVHHHNYLTALTVISVNNIQRDQLINHVVPSLENKGIVNYFGSMIPAYRYISLDESTRMCIKAFRAHPESNDKEHITKPAVITVSVIDQMHEEYSKAEVNTSVVNNSIQPLFRIHHDINQEGFSIELPSEWCIGYTREKSNEESSNTSILFEDADIIQHVRNTSDSMEEGIIAMEYPLLHNDGSSGTIIDVNMQWQQGKHLVMNDGASINTSYTLDNNVDRHMLVQGYTPSNDRCLLSMYLVEIPSTKSYDILFLATNSLVEMREIMRAALSKVDMIDHLFDEPLYMSIDEDDNTDVEHTTMDDDDDVVSNNIAVELIDGIMFLEGNIISYANDIDLSSKYLADIPIYNSNKAACMGDQLERY
ncbi:hypothetical protein BDF22DRAFT_388978 [Syncephalis plumigaleata]|nr:hypothetical protein BDF22DRAFT_388978 [Syncephalis plumigaleata]